ncbi:MAG: LUD domain-containing protein [Candidatus Binatia bacterium]
MTRQEEFRSRAAEALARPGIRSALGKFGTAYRSARAEAMTVLDYETSRMRLREAKENAIERLPDLAEQFVLGARRSGAFVYEARTAEEANAYIAQLAKDRGVTLAIKSKSMVSEEIGLNHYLERLGIATLEADCGEWIIQQAGEKPSHSVMPAVHLSKEEVAGIFTKALGRPIPPDIPIMVSTLRDELRGKFVEAGMGISGANIAVAETGTLIIVTNEGNGRLVTTLPPLHVALLGYDKIVPTLEEAGHQLKLLAKAATAQGLTVYTTFITGKVGVSGLPRPSGFQGSLKPELHIVLLDNGRWAMRGDPEFREALNCIRCASCANVCPTYRVVGGHVFGHIYTAAIGTVITPFHHSWNEAAVPQEACLLCRACVDACPAEIDLPRMIVALRSRLEEKGEAKGVRAFFLNRILPDPRLLRLSLKLAAFAQLPFVKGGMVNRLPGPLKRLTIIRSIPPLALRPLRDRLLPVVAPKGKKKLTVTFFASCLLDFLYPEIGEAVVQILTHHGVEVRFPKSQGCCGLPAYHEGKKEVAKKMARDLIAALEAKPSDYVVTAAPPCGIMIRQYLPRLMEGYPTLEAEAMALAGKSMEFSEFLVKVLQLGGDGEAFQKPGEGRTLLTYHDSCSALRGLRLCDAPRRLVKSLKGYAFRELDEVGECCGFGGHFSADYPDVAGHVVERKVASIERSGGAVVAVDSPGCLLHIRGALQKKGSSIQIRHLAELLAEEIAGGG